MSPWLPGDLLRRRGADFPRKDNQAISHMASPLAASLHNNPLPREHIKTILARTCGGLYTPMYTDELQTNKPFSKKQRTVELGKKNAIQGPTYVEILQPSSGLYTSLHT